MTIFFSFVVLGAIIVIVNVVMDLYRLSWCVAINVVINDFSYWYDDVNEIAIIIELLPTDRGGTINHLINCFGN